MRYGAHKQTGPWSLTLRIPYNPRCPGCTEFLNPQVARIFGGWAWCALCLHLELSSQPWSAQVLDHTVMLDRSVCAHGVRFYCPEEDPSEIKTLYEWYELLATEPCLAVVEPQPFGAYGLTPAGECLLAELDLRPLKRFEEDFKRARRRPV